MVHTPDDSRAADVVRDIRTIFPLPPSSSRLEDFSRMLNQFIKEQQAGNPELYQRSASALAAHIYRLVRLATSEQAELVTVCANALIHLGPMGQILFIHLVETDRFNLDNAADLMVEIKDDLRLAIANRFLHSSYRNNTEFQHFCIDVLALVQESSSVESMRFLSSQKNVLPSLSHAVRYALRSSPLRTRVESGIKFAANRNNLEDMAKAAIQLDLPNAPELLSERLNPEHKELCLVALHTLHTIWCEFPRETMLKVGRLINSNSRSLRMAALETLCAMDARTGRIACNMFRKVPSLRKAIALRSVLFTARDYKAFVSQLRHEERRAVGFSTFVALGRVDPQAVRNYLHSAASKAPSEVGTAQNVARLEKLVEELRFKEPSVPELPASTQKQTHTHNSRTLEREHFASEVHDKTTFTDLIIDRSLFSNSHFIACSFDNCTISRCGIRNSVFTDCTFRNCTFSDCDITESVFIRSEISHAIFTSCIVEASGFNESTLLRTAFDDCAISDLCVYKGAWRGVRIKRCCVMGSEFGNMLFASPEFLDCAWKEATFTSCEVRWGDINACTFEECKALDLRTDHPLLLDIMDRTRRERFRSSMHSLEQERMPSGLTIEMLELAVLTMDLHFRHEARAAMTTPFLRNNERRITWGLEKLTARQRDFFKLVPLLLHTHAFDQHFDLFPVPPCRINAYTPNYSSIETAFEYLPDQTFEEPVGEAISIEAIYTIGSLGTVAQNRKSDIDYWVCCDMKGVPEADVEGLQRKCDRLTQWAEQEFDLEVYFFIMDVESVRKNQFGFSSKESSGSAQAMMLKEEFYRTATLVAGKKPVWWLLPAGAGQDEYDATLALNVRPHAADRYVDLGHVAHIPHEEFFGASLWQIVKAINSPFKSIMKFGLLEKYLHTSKKQNGFLLCDRIKSSILSRRKALWDVDPYVLLFMDVADFYARRQQPAKVELLKKSFLLKADLSAHVAEESEDAPALIPLRQEDEDSRELVTRSVIAQTSCLQDSSGKEDWTLESFIATGAQINTFIIDTYNRLRSSEQSHSLTINPQDLTRLGRKIFARFAPKQDKIDLLPLKLPPSLPIDKLSFTQPRVQAVKHNVQVTTGQLDPVTRLYHMVELRTEPDLHRLLAWIGANGLWRNNTAISTDYTLSPVISKDIEDFLRIMQEFFPHGPTFNTPVAETLKKERIARALLVINLQVKREEPTIREAAIIYSTNWGELFCKTVAVDGQTMETDPLAFIRASVDLDCGIAPVMGCFVPDRAMCPRPLL